MPPAASERDLGVQHVSAPKPVDLRPRLAPDLHAEEARVDRGERAIRPREAQPQPAVAQKERARADRELDAFRPKPNAEVCREPIRRTHDDRSAEPTERRAEASGRLQPYELRRPRGLLATRA